MNSTDWISGGLFLAIGIGLIASGSAFPAGVGGLPGAGFFPQAIGAVMAMLACALVVTRRKKDASDSIQMGNARQVAGAAGLLFVYLLLWGQGLFILRTAVFLILTLRFLGQRWWPATACSAALTAFAYLAFDTALNVSLD